MSRTRFRLTGANAVGSIFYTAFGLPWTYYLGGGVRSKTYLYMIDYTSQQPYPDNPLNGWRWDVTNPVRINGRTTFPVNSTYWYDFRNYSPDVYPNPYDNLPIPGATVPTAYLVTKALGNVNPSTPVIDIPNFLFEFKDFPGMLKNAGDILSGIRHISKGINPKKINDGFLAYQFGWKPLFSDLRNLLGIAESIEKRRKYLLDYQRGGRVHRRLGGNSADLGHSTHYWQVGTTDNLEWDSHLTESWDYWFSCNMKVTVDIPSLARADYLAARATLGLNLSAVQIWNAIPWSFLVDYFANVGDMLAAGRGYIPHQVTNMCIMAKGTVLRVSTPTIATANGVTVSGGSAKCVSKTRSVFSNPTPSLALKPFLTNGQIANLGALALARIFR